MYQLFPVFEYLDAWNFEQQTLIISFLYILKCFKANMPL